MAGEMLVPEVLSCCVVALTAADGECACCEGCAVTAAAALGLEVIACGCDSERGFAATRADSEKIFDRRRGDSLTAARN